MNSNPPSTLAVSAPASASAFVQLPNASPWLCFIATLFALMMLNIAIYLSGLSAPFVSESVDSIRNNPALDQWDISGPHWLAMATFALDRSLYGNNVRGFHATSIAIHLVASALLFWAVYVTLGMAKHSIRWKQARLPVASLTALLWSVHPLQTQAVLHTIQRTETLMSVFFLAAVILFALGLQARSAIPYLMGAAACYFLALGCKEVAIALPAVLLLYDFVCDERQAGGWWGNLGHGARKRGWFYVLLFVISLSLVPKLAATAGRLPAKETQTSESFAVELATSGVVADSVTAASPALAPVDYLLTQSKVIAQYVGLAIFPRGQNFEHAYEITHTTFDRLVYPSAVALIGLLGLVAAFRGWLTGLCIATFFMVLAPTSSILPFGDLMVEDRMYLPSAALVALVCGGLFTVIKNHRLAVASGLMLCLLLAATAIARVQVYRTAVSLWSDSIEKQPDNPRAMANLGKSFAELVLFQKSLDTLDRAIELTEHRVRVPALTDVASLRSDKSEIENSYAILQTRNKNYGAAQQLLESAIENNPQNAAAHSSLGNVFAKLRDKPRAIASYRAALAIDPGLEAAAKNLEIVSAPQAPTP